MKHSILLSKVQKASKKSLKRRRPSKKLAVTLDALADALPELGEDNASGIDGAAEKGGGGRSKSLRTRPGSMKRKEAVERLERERFGMNMARLVGQGGGGAAGGQEGSLTKMEALRRHLQQQMQNGE